MSSDKHSAVTSTDSETRDDSPDLSGRSSEEFADEAMHLGMEGLRRAALEAKRREEARQRREAEEARHQQEHPQSQK